MLKGLLNRLKRRKPKEPAYLTLEDAIASGLVTPPPLKVTKPGFWIRVWSFSKDEYGRTYPRTAEDIWWTDGWRAWRYDKQTVYHGGTSRYALRDIPTGIREPILNLGHGSTDSEHRVGKSLLIDAGHAKPTYDLDEELR
ncbi:MAG: hypothetical protein OJJ55_06570 [Rhodococcus sp.]|nr:hypothetical protein [Rhodococcus sp. (in: high G+C Gram-positive bacteria)]